MDDARARPILQRVLARRDAASVCLRRKAVFLIAQEDAAGTEDILLETARTDPDHEVREQAVFWLSQVETDKAVGALDSILRTLEGPLAPGEGGLRPLAARQRARAQALRGLRRAGGPARRPEGKGHLLDRPAAAGRTTRPSFAPCTEGSRRRGCARRCCSRSRRRAAQENARWLLGIAQRRHPADRAAEEGAVLGRTVRRLDGRPHRPVRLDARPRDARAARLRLLAARRAGGGGQADRDRAQATPTPSCARRRSSGSARAMIPRAAKALQDVIEQP